MVAHDMAAATHYTQTTNNNDNEQWQQQMMMTMMPSNAPNISTAQMSVVWALVFFFLLNLSKWTDFSPAPRVLCGAGFFSTLYQPPPIFDP